MKKQKHTLIKRVAQVTGTTVGITFTKPEQKIYGIKKGCDIDLGDMIVINHNTEIKKNPNSGQPKTAVPISVKFVNKQKDEVE